MTRATVWFGGAVRPLFGWFEAPDEGEAKGGVVLCPPFGVEIASSSPALRELSRRLVAAGFATLRFDYDGTGDSSGLDDDPDRVAAWKSSIRHGVEFIRSTGCERVAVVGLRLGATLAADELGGDPVDAVVLWDPCPTGRSFMRQQTMLRKLIDRGHVLDDGTVEGPGLVLSPETVGDLGSLRLEEHGQIAKRVLLLTRTLRPLPSDVRRSWDRPGVESREIEGQESLVDVEPARAVVPDGTLDTVVTWLSEVVDGPPVPVQAPPEGSAVVGTTADGRSITERPVRLGPHGLFGIETTVDGVAAATPVLFLNAGLIDHVGPSRTWVNLARRGAEDGIRSIRFDMSGIGDTPLRPGSTVRATRTLDGLADVADAQRAASPGDPSDVIMVGLCSGTYQATEAALATGARAIVMINPTFRIGLNVEEPEAATTGIDRQAAESPRGWTQLIPGRSQIWEVIRRTPEPVWSLINRVAFRNAPSALLLRLTRAGVQVMVACDDHDAWVIQRGSYRALHGARSDGSLRVEVVDGIDHTLFCRDSREVALALVAGYLAGVAPERSPS
jgi:pimeloyl-ACP methyl ester carboxylesterase